MRTTAAAAVLTRSRAADYAALAKPRLNILVVGSALAGYVMAGGDTANAVALLCTVIGTGLVAGGASAFNQIIERDADAQMRRTRTRPLPDGRLTAFEVASGRAVAPARSACREASPATPHCAAGRPRKRPAPGSCASPSAATWPWTTPR